ncbi:uncharacterized protein [Hetaerina americana]|uniref:uncharacterized protein n=1 Tax=Hetaerina americana TaxID=62018 RepID=UPI003A7F437D
MGSPLSPVIANFYMEKFEKSAIETISKKPKLWLRYVDDTFVIWQHGTQELNDFLRHLNNQHRAIKFRMELEKNKQIPFLDVLVKRKEDGGLGHAVYRKATHTDRYLNSLSHHHPAQKASLVATIVHRAYELSEAESLSAEKKHIMTALQKNGYKRSVVLKRTAKEEKRRLNHSEIRSDGETTKIYATIPYIAGTKVPYWPTCRSSTRASAVEDQLCSLAGPFRPEKSAIAGYSSIMVHSIEFDETKSLARSVGYWGRVIKEAIEIWMKS